MQLFQNIIVALASVGSTPPLRFKAQSSERRLIRQTLEVTYGHGRTGRQSEDNGPKLGGGDRVAFTGKKWPEDQLNFLEACAGFSGTAQSASSSGNYGIKDHPRG